MTSEIISSRVVSESVFVIMDGNGEPDVMVLKSHGTAKLFKVKPLSFGDTGLFLTNLAEEQDSSLYKHPPLGSIQDELIEIVPKE